MTKYQVLTIFANASGFVSYGGVKVPCGEAVTAELSPEWLKRLENHPEFTVKAVKPATDKKDT